MSSKKLNSYIVYAKRSAIGSFAGSLASVRPDDLLAELLKDLKKNLKFDAALIDDIIIGCANQAGEDNRNIARMSSLLAGLPESISAVTINRLCGSSLDALIDGACRIAAGLNQCLVIGGVESMSRAPYVMSKPESSFDRNQKIWDTSIGWRFPNSKMEKLFPLFSMGETAEEVAKRLKISRSDQDQFAFNSHQKAIAAIKTGAFKDEILPIEIQQKKQNIIFATDEGPRPDTSLEKLATLKSAFIKDGTVTAGNSSSINDGAAVILLVSEEFLKAHNLKPLAKITGGATAGLEPNIMGLGPVYAVKKLLKNYSYQINDFNLIELNEAFAAQALGCIRELKFDESIINKNGGSIAIGHPLGCSGARIVTTMVHQMQKNKNYKLGLASMCIGVGQGIALSVENCL